MRGISKLAMVGVILVGVMGFGFTADPATSSEFSKMVESSHVNKAVESQASVEMAVPTAPTTTDELARDLCNITNPNPSGYVVDRIFWYTTSNSAGQVFLNVKCRFKPVVTPNFGFLCTWVVIRIGPTTGPVGVIGPVALGSHDDVTYDICPD